MALRPEYEAVRASLLHRHPRPTLDMAIQEIIFEETPLNLNKTPHSEMALAANRPSHQKFGNHICKNYNHIGHTFANCPIVECRYCHGLSHILRIAQLVLHDKLVGSLNFSMSRSWDLPVIAASTDGSTGITMSDLEALLKQVISSNSHAAMSVTPANSHWLFDSACCNYMTTNINLLSSTTHVSCLPPIHTTNGTQMNITHTGHASTSNHSLPETYYILNLALNLISVGQVCEKGLNINFPLLVVRYRIHKRDGFLGRVAGGSII